MELNGNVVWKLVWESDWMTKAVLLTLLFMSVLCWAIFFYKIIQLQKARKQLNDAIALLKTAQSLEMLRSTAFMFTDSIPGAFLQAHMTWCAEHSVRGLSEIKSFFIDQARAHADLLIDDVLHEQEAYLPILFSCSAVSPLLGLFGTIWGLIHSFLRISEKQSADIVTVAPGISEALITTLAGLMVAIPAVMMYHYLATQIKALEQHLVKLSERALALSGRDARSL
jgi:biopolymer transport protein TolQ